MVLAHGSQQTETVGAVGRALGQRQVFILGVEETERAGAGPRARRQSTGRAGLDAGSGLLAGSISDSICT